MAWLYHGGIFAISLLEDHGLFDTAPSIIKNIFSDLYVIHVGRVDGRGGVVIIGPSTYALHKQRFVSVISHPPEL